MNLILRQPFFNPIRQYLWIDPSVPVDAVNDLINQMNAALASISVGGSNYVGSFATAALPAGQPYGTTAFAADARKVAEGPGAGTGVMVYNSSLGWRCYSADQPPLT